MHIEASQSCICIVDMVCGARGCRTTMGSTLQCIQLLGALGSVFLGMGGGEFMSSAFWCMGTMCHDPARVVHIEASQSCLCIVDMVCETSGVSDQHGEHIAMHIIVGCLWPQCFWIWVMDHSCQAPPLVHGQGVLGCPVDCAH